MNFPNMFPPNNHHHLREKPDEHCQEITLFNNYHNNQHFGQPQEYFRENSKTASTMMQDGFDFASQKPELSKKRKAEDQLIDVHGGGGRVVRPVAGKDKHSKVSTARGPRDRRLRLSPKTAIQFYDVQDRLGYDRPSKAIDWLIKEAKSAIDALDDAAAEINNRSPPSNGGGERRFSNDEKPVSGFGNFLLDGAAAAPPPSSSTEFPFHRLGLGQGFCASSGLPSTCQEIVDNNTIWEIDRLQRVIKAWNCDINGNQFLPGNNNTMEITNFQAAQPIIFGNSQMFHQREPLQSSIINYSPISPYFPVVGFPDGDELSSITAAATLREDGKDKNYSKFQE